MEKYIEVFGAPDELSDESRQLFYAHFNPDYVTYIVISREAGASRTIATTIHNTALDIIGPTEVRPGEYWCVTYA